MTEEWGSERKRNGERTTDEVGEGESARERRRRGRKKDLRPLQRLLRPEAFLHRESPQGGGHVRWCGRKKYSAGRVLFFLRLSVTLFFFGGLI